MLDSSLALRLPRPLILGSTSRYRRELLERMQLPFTTVSPDVDEAPLIDETPYARSLRLAEAKARAVAALHPGALVIGSDQVPELDGQPLSKPGTHERATEQLRQMSGRQMNFHTGVCVICQETGFIQVDVVTVNVRFRELNDAEIERYLRAEQPYDCAGSAKSEGLGIALLDALTSDDPTALVGLPLIRTCQMLRAAGVVLP